MKNRKFFLLGNLLIVLFIFFVASVSGAQPLLDQPVVQGGTIRPGEALEYTVKIKGIPAGTQVWQVSDKSYLNGQEVYHVKSTSKVNSFFNVFYAFDDRSESFIRSRDFSPVRYSRRIVDGKYRGYTSIDFDLTNGVASVEKDKKHQEVDIPEGIQDELSMIYLLRTREMEVGESYEFDALVGSKTTEVEVSVLRTEKIKTILGTLKTIVVRTIPKDITIWLTNDSDRIPVKIEASTKIGRLVANLNSIR